MFKLKNKSINSDFSNLSLKVFQNISPANENDFLASYNLPKDLFYFDHIKPVAPRFEIVHNNQLGEVMVLVISNLHPTPPPNDVESRLETHTFIISQTESFWFIKDNYSKLYDQLATTYVNDIEKIDYLNKQANHQTNNKILNEVTQTEQNLVILEHTIESQEIAVSNLIDHSSFLELLDNDTLVHDVKWYNQQVNRLIHVYRDLFDAVSSLYSGIVSNNLNVLMKFLSSISIVLAASSFIAELWGMNTGGLPFESNNFGFFIMFTIAIFSGFIMYLFLKSRHFFDD